MTLFGAPASVGAEVRRERDGEGANDSFTIRLHFYTGFSATLSANLLSSLARPRFHLRGIKGNYWKWGLDPQEDALNKITHIDTPTWGHEPATNWGTISIGADHDLMTRQVESVPGDYRLFYQGVRDALQGNAKPPVEAIDAWRTARVLEWAAESAKTHCDIQCDWSMEPE